MQIDHPLKDKSIPISSKFGPRKHPVTHEESFHKGIDYAVPTGTPVYAVVDAKAHAWEDAISGKYVMLEYLTPQKSMMQIYYFHLSEMRKFDKGGTPVKKGDLLGHTGQTGRVTGPHLHFEIRKFDREKDKFVAIEPSQFIV